MNLAPIQMKAFELHVKNIWEEDSSSMCNLFNTKIMYVHTKDSHTQLLICFYHPFPIPYLSVQLAHW